jgi:hypothetical protein
MGRKTPARFLKWGGSSLAAAAQKARQTGMINLYTTGK